MKKTYEYVIEADVNKLRMGQLLEWLFSVPPYHLFRLTIEIKKWLSRPLKLSFRISPHRVDSLVHRVSLLLGEFT
jgi:hypothetical protein